MACNDDCRIGDVIFIDQLVHQLLGWCIVIIEGNPDERIFDQDLSSLIWILAAEQ